MSKDCLEGDLHVKGLTGEYPPRLYSTLNHQHATTDIEDNKREIILPQNGTSEPRHSVISSALGVHPIFTTIVFSFESTARCSTSESTTSIPSSASPESTTSTTKPTAAARGTLISDTTTATTPDVDEKPWSVHGTE
ncbi:hypothetical protein CALVIDRAFT_111703 [Calocera viscosa TUFC12733]|uniref:Uncharacterized protein n=1 Tax=Calocera viscosa (strain TUFC12733) TaxID=1330018 RepID=A0A167MI52_CALVF|nr:hypothetical protein CALVIDRAFT_111703 [Calocera viscosa TUFC12733]